MSSLIRAVRAPGAERLLARGFASRVWKPLPENRLFDRKTPESRDIANHRAPGTVKLLALEDLQDNPGARHKEKRLGRGRASHKGKTSGRGHKGIGQRRAVGRIWFEGGQTPLARMVPKVGQRDEHPHYRPASVNLGRIRLWVKMGRLSADHPIDLRSLVRSGCVHKIPEDGLKVLGEGAKGLDFPIHLQVTDASKSAVEAVEKAGGKLELVYFNQRSLLSHLRPEKFTTPARQSYPPPKRAAKFGLPALHYVAPQKKADPSVVEGQSEQ